MEETRAVARLPGLDIEIYHAGDEQAETLTVRLRATPSFEAVAGWLDPTRFLALSLAASPWLALNPWVAPFLLPGRARDAVRLPEPSR